MCLCVCVCLLNFPLTQNSSLSSFYYTVLGLIHIILVVQVSLPIQVYLAYFSHCREKGTLCNLRIIHFTQVSNTSWNKLIDDNRKKHLKSESIYTTENYISIKVEYFLKNQHSVFIICRLRGNLRISRINLSWVNLTFRKWEDNPLQ